MNAFLFEASCSNTFTSPGVGSLFLFFNGLQKIFLESFFWSSIVTFSLGFILFFISEYEDDKISLPFVVTDLLGRNLKLLKEKAVCEVRALSRNLLSWEKEMLLCLSTRPLNNYSQGNVTSLIFFSWLSFLGSFYYLLFWLYPVDWSHCIEIHTHTHKTPWLVGI